MAQKTVSVLKAAAALCCVHCELIGAAVLSSAAEVVWDAVDIQHIQAQTAHEYHQRGHRRRTTKARLLQIDIVFAIHTPSATLEIKRPNA